MILTNEEKLSVVSQHIKNYKFAKYGLELTIQELRVSKNVDQPQIDSILLQIEDIDAKLLLLENEANTLRFAAEETISE